MCGLLKIEVHSSYKRPYMVYMGGGGGEEGGKGKVVIMQKLFKIYQLSSVHKGCFFIH